MRGGKREGAGRPLGSKNRNPLRNVVKPMRWTELEWAEIQVISNKIKLKPYEYLRALIFGGIGDKKIDNHLRRAWCGIKNRCYNENDLAYYRYGGKGVTLCNEWHNFDTFKEWAIHNGYIVGLEFGRKNHSLGYSPANCKLETKSENSSDVAMRMKYGEDYRERNIKPAMRPTKIYLDLTPIELTALSWLVKENSSAKRKGKSKEEIASGFCFLRILRKLRKLETGEPEISLRGGFTTP